MRIKKMSIRHKKKLATYCRFAKYFFFLVMFFVHILRLQFVEKKNNKNVFSCITCKLIYIYFIISTNRIRLIESCITAFTRLGDSTPIGVNPLIESVGNPPIGWDWPASGEYSSCLKLLLKRTSRWPIFCLHKMIN